MKNRIIIFLASVFLGATLYSCNEEQVGQTPTDSTPPGKITNPTVENLPGGARILYTLPKDNDLLYVKAVYYINGVEKTDAASLYEKSVEVMGFGSTNEQSVWLYCVDRSGNQSEAVEVKIKPTTPPITLIRESMTMQESFGGVRITWKNKYKANVAIFLLATDSIGDIQPADVIYTSAADGKFNLRNFDDTERIFGVYVRDRWDNYSDTLLGTFTPMIEILIPKTNFRQRILTGDSGSSASGWPFTRLWDGKTDNGQAWSQTGATVPNYFTIDLGVTAKLSRHLFWHWQNWENGILNYVYNYSGMKKGKIYGASELSDSTDPEYWKEGFKNDWFLLSDFEVFKPSGDDGPITMEDMEFAAAGFEFEIAIEAPPVRYIRYQAEVMYSGTVSVNMAEVSFWGQVIE